MNNMRSNESLQSERGMTKSSEGGYITTKLGQIHNLLEVQDKQQYQLKESVSKIYPFHESIDKRPEDSFTPGGGGSFADEMDKIISHLNRISEKNAQLIQHLNEIL